MARFCPLFSGSSGNCSYVGSASTGILVDAGVSARRIETALSRRGIDPAGIHAVFVTHEHRDHVAGLRVFAKRYGCRVYATAGTLAALLEIEAVDPQTPLCSLEDGAAAEADLCVTAFPTSHDSRESCGFRIHTADDRTVVIATDTGVVTDAIRQAIAGGDLVLIESNHDVRLLQNSSYPFFLKQRILSASGHLSNDTCAGELAALVAGGTSRLILGHLSRENNRPELAYLTARQTLTEAGFSEGTDYLLAVAEPESTKGVIRF